MNVYALSAVRVNGGTLVVVVAEPNTAITWELVGPGSLVSLADRTNEAGVASARYDAAGVAQGASVTVRVTAYA